MTKANLLKQQKTKQMRKTFGSLILTTAILLASSSLYAQGSGYHVVTVFHIPSAGRWDYIAVSPVNNNLYVSHMTQVNILNKNTGDSVGVIANTEGVHGIAFAPAFKKGFVSNGKLNTVTVFDINSNAVLAQIKTGENPDAIMYDPYSKKVYVCDGKSKDLTIIDPANNEVVKTVALGGKPETAVSNNAGKIYINIEDKNEIAVVSTKTHAVESRWRVGKGDEPSGLAIDVKTKRLFAGCGNKLLVVLDAENGKVLKELPIGDGCDGVAFDPGTKYVFSSNGDGTLTIIHEKSASDIVVIDNVSTKKGARTLAVDERTHKVYLPTANFGTPAAGEKRPPMVPGTFQVLVVGK
jgi:YVTN family beta-propeller protein